MLRPGATEYVPFGAKVEFHTPRLPEEIAEFIREMLRQNAMVLESNRRIMERLGWSLEPFAIWPSEDTHK